MIKDLIALANKLDRKGMHKEADLIDAEIQRMATDLPGGGRWYQTAPGNVVAPSKPNIGYEQEKSYTDPETGEETPIWQGSKSGVKEEEILPGEAKKLRQKDFAAGLSESLAARHHEMLDIAERLKQQAPNDLDERLLSLAVRFIDNSMREVFDQDLPPKHKIALYGEVMGRADEIFDGVSDLMEDRDLLDSL